jgi:predicted Zn-dependent protease
VFPWATLDAGWALVTLGRDEEARVRLLGAVRDGPPAEFPARLTLARIQERAGERDPAKETLAAGIAGEVGDPIAMTRLGEMLAREGREEDGVELLRAAHEAFPELESIRSRLERLQGAGETAEAASGARLDPTIRDVEERLLNGELSVFALVVEPDSCSPGDSRRFLRALQHHLGGDWPAAIAWTEGAGPETPGLLVVRALSLERVDRASEAMAALETLSEAGRSSWLVDEHRARLLAHTDPQAAADLEKRLLETHPRDPRLHIRIAKLRERAGDSKGAVEALREARRSGWLTELERVQLRAAIEDLEDLQRSEGDDGVVSPDPKPEGP